MKFTKFFVAGTRKGRFLVEGNTATLPSVPTFGGKTVVLLKVEIHLLIDSLQGNNDPKDIEIKLLFEVLKLQFKSFQKRTFS